MMLAADYTDKRACPFCHAPARKRGKWANEDGRWTFAAVPLVCSERTKPPYHHTAQWTQVTIESDKHDKDGEVVGVKTREVYQFVTTHECSNLDCEPGQNLHTTEPYTGPHIPRLMDAPGELVAIGELRLGKS